MALTKINASVIANNTIAVGNIADNSVDATKIASNSILTRHIDDAQITTDQILDGTIATADIADDAVTSAKIDTNIDIAGTFDVTGATTLDSTLTVASHVGIGTTSPTTFSGYVSVHHKNTAGDAIHLIESDGGIIGQTFVNDASGVVTTGARSNHPWRVTTNDTERLRISGNNLFLNGGTDARIQLGSGGAGANQVSNNTVHIRGDGVDAKYMAASGGDHIFESNGGHLVTMKDDGKVGIGTTSPARSPLHLATSGSDYCQLHMTNGTSGSASGDGLTLFTNSTDAGLMQRENSYLLFGTNDTERMRISSTGNLLINTTTDTAKLYINQATTNQQAAFFYSNTSNTVPLVYILQDGAGSNSSAHALYVKNDGAGDPINIESTHSGGVAFRMSYLGEVAIIRNTFYVSGEGTSFAAGSHNGMQFAVNGQSVSSRAATNLQTHKSFYNPNGSVGTIKTTGSATQFNTSSDYRLKENIVTDWDGTTLLKQLKPSKFNFKADTDTTVQGFLAHEVSSIVPQAVSGEKDAVYTAEEAADGEGVEGQPNYQGIDQSKLVPLLVKTIQELEARIATLEG